MPAIYPELVGKHRAIVGLLLLGTLACGPQPPSDTGYVGTWVRGSDAVRSTMSIFEGDGKFDVHWAVDSSDGISEVLCDWDGNCEGFDDGLKTREYTLKTWVEEANGHLMLECSGRWLVPPENEIHFIDELVLEEGGLTLTFIKLEQGGQVYPEKSRPKYRYSKVSDLVFGRDDG